MDCWVYEHGAWRQTNQGLSYSDRGLVYGDGLFETCRVHQGKIPLLDLHKQRLKYGLQALYFPATTANLVETALASLPSPALKAGGKLLVTRGISQRGYDIPADITPSLIWYSFDTLAWGIERFPEGYQVDLNSVLLARQPMLAGIKHLNRLEQVLARSKFVEGCQEMVMCDMQGYVVEGTMSNLFWFKDGYLFTPSLHYCGVRGVVRSWLMQQQRVNIVRIPPKQLMEADAVFFTNAISGLVPVKQLSGHVFAQNDAWQSVLQLQKKLELLYC
ncbi:MAG: aminodeoxychorismate lyase [Venatoribacter sp.]